MEKNLVSCFILCILILEIAPQFSEAFEDKSKCYIPCMETCQRAQFSIVCDFQCSSRCGYFPQRN